MTSRKRIQRPWLWLPTSLAHDLSPSLLNFYGALKKPTTYHWNPVNWKGLQFNNPLGIAGGVDKEARNISGWWAFGAGFIEIGTVTPQPQGPNPGTIIKRFLKEEALWNKMGFPNSGAEAACINLKKLKKHTTPIFINIGKNRDTPNEEALKDYASLIHKLTPYADAFVINISSPNTKNLRDLQSGEHLNTLLEGVAKANKGSSIPLLLKLSPDSVEGALEETLEIATKNNIDGFILTNTTASRVSPSPFPTEGGVSGKPLAALSKKALQQAVDFLGDQAKDFLIISTGGVLTPQDVFERLELGADLVQVYSTLVLDGPFFFKKTMKAWEQHSSSTR